MKDKSLDLSEWVLDVGLESLMDYAECKDCGLCIHNVYLSDVALAVHVSCKPGIFGIRNLKEDLGRFLRFLSGFAEEVGFVLPLLCVIEAHNGESAIEKTTLDQWAADQDWHRGDFSIIVATDDEDVKEVLQTTLGSVEAAWPPVRLEARDLNAIIDSFESERRSLQVSADRAGLLAAIGEALREGTGGSINEWLQQRMNDVQQLTEGREKNGP